MIDDDGDDDEAPKEEEKTVSVPHSSVHDAPDRVGEKG